jgi:hypothetical protein
MKNVTLAVLAGVIGLIFVGSAISQSESDINAKVAQLDIDKATLDDVIRIFGEPGKYMWNNETFTKDNLPLVYTAEYPGGFSAFMSRGKIRELRFEGSGVGYVFRGKLKLGSSLDEVLEVLGQPRETVVGQPMGEEDAVLYKDMSGRKGHCYYSRKDQGIRLFFLNYKVVSLYLTSTAQRGPSETGRASKVSAFQVKPIESVKEFDDVRWKDMSKLDLADRRGLVATLVFNQKTIWPAPEKMPVGVDPNQVLTSGMSPGLGVRDLHRQGITGKGVNVAIIDQAMYLDHPEFAGKIVAYHDLAASNKSSMHGPGVTSLLVGANCGTAPDARVYYVAARDMVYEVDYAEGLDWIIEQNANLPASEKIRVVSVSAAPGIAGTPSGHNQKRWNDACARAEKAGIMVLDCTDHHGFIGKCWYNARVPDSVSACRPGDPRYSYHATDRLLVPSAPRTTAEEYDKGDCSYQYCGTGGLSWSIPYCAGVLALGWQLRPDIPPERMRELLFKSAYTKKDDTKIINPRRFIHLVKTAKGQSVSKGQGKAGND